MSTVLAALASDASGRPVLSTPIALADLLDATVTSLHVREWPLSAAPELARAGSVELREVSGAPVEQIVAAAQDPDVAALVLGVPADDIVAVADDTSANLIVLAWSQNLAPGHAHVVS